MDSYGVLRRDPVPVRLVKHPGLETIPPNMLDRFLTLCDVGATMGTPLRTPLAIGFTVLAISGCGASSSTNSTLTATDSAASSAQPSPAESASNTGRSTLVANVEAICARRNAAISTVGTTANTEAQLRHIAKGRAAVEQTTLNELTKLATPTQLEPSWRKFIAYRRTLIKDWIAVSKQHGAGDRSAHALSLAELAQKDMLKAAKEAHLKQCTEVD